MFVVHSKWYFQLIIYYNIIHYLVSSTLHQLRKLKQGWKSKEKTPNESWPQNRSQNSKLWRFETAVLIIICANLWPFSFRSFLRRVFNFLLSEFWLVEVWANRKSVFLKTFLSKEMLNIFSGHQSCFERDLILSNSQFRVWISDYSLRF